MVDQTILRTTQDLADRISKEMFVLALSYKGYKLAEIGEIMGIGVDRVQQIKRKALVRVKNQWRDYNRGHETI